MEQKAYAVLKSVFGYDALRSGQQPLVEAVLDGRDALGIMPTGAGKSLCFQLPALCLPGITLVVSPLISLMRDQVMSLVQQGVAAAYLNSSLTPGQYAKATANLQAGKYKIVYVAPERLLTDRFLWALEELDISFVAVDEAHCVSQWGQDFRPAYLQIADFIDRLPHRPPVAAFTATATPKVRQDILQLLRLHQPETVVTGFDRPNLRLRVLQPQNKNQALLELLEQFEGQSGIIYCSTRKQVEQVHALLVQKGFSAARYHAGLEDAERHAAQEDFLFDRAQVIVATNAFGMGIDKSDTRFVIHYNMPLDLESYYQEAGRAGRDGEPAECVLLYSGQDVRLGQFLIEKSAEAHEDEEDPETAAQLKARAEDRLRRMTWYCHSRRCLRAELLGYFGQKAAPVCGNCSVCLGEGSVVRAADAPRPARQPAPRKAMAEGPADEALFQKLRTVRAELARRQGVPAFVVFTDATLRQMSILAPTDRAGLLQVSGVGEEKARRYGEEMLQAIREYRQEHP